MIQLNHVYKTFFKGKDTEVHALDDVTMTVKDGDFVTITGPSGSGKSTLMRVVEGMECADQGNCILNGIDLAKSSDKKRAEIRNQKMGIVLQDFGLFNDQTVKQNLQLPFLIAKRSIKSANIRAQEILEYLHIAELTNRKVQTLSGGQKQRVASARAIVTEPSLILADEPTGALDSKSARLLLERLESLNTELSATILMVTHDAFTASYAHRILFIKDGKIFTELVRGNDSRKEFFNRIMEVITMLGGDDNNVF